MRRLIDQLLTRTIVACTVFYPLIVCAQEAPPQPTLNRGAPAWLGLAIIFILLAIVMAVSLMPSKRGHQD